MKISLGALVSATVATLAVLAVPLVITLVALAVVSALGGNRQSLPADFTIQHADGITYVCSTHPVMCTGNQP